MISFALLAFLGWLYLAGLHGKFWQPLLEAPVRESGARPSVTIVVPARNEAAVLPQSLPSLLAQDYAGDWKIVLVDDHSADGTSDVARNLAAKSGKAERLHIVKAPDLPSGWSGKVAAMHAGVAQSQSDLILFTDADIWHPKSSLRRLVAEAEGGKLDLLSRMVKLNVASFAERLLIPAFVFFFAMLYPFRKVEDPRSRVAGAAGGVMLARRAVLEKSGGLAGIKAALIDDCALARLIKTHKGRVRLTLTQDILSLRPYPAIADVWGMIARTAFTQLDYSPILLVGTVMGLGLLFFVPLAAILFGWVWSIALGLAAWLLMSFLYHPTTRFYGLPWFWSFTLPCAALVYLAATVDSARRHWQGRGGAWKGRRQAALR